TGHTEAGVESARDGTREARPQGAESDRGREVPGRGPRGERDRHGPASGGRGEGGARAPSAPRERTEAPETHREDPSSASAAPAAPVDPVWREPPRRDFRGRVERRGEAPGLPRGCPGADDQGPGDREEGPRPGPERRRDPEDAQAGSRRLRGRRLRHGLAPRRRDPQGTRGGPADSLGPSATPPFAAARMGIA